MTTALPPGCLPLGLTKSQASALIGVSPSFFDGLVKAGAMPERIKSATLGRKLLWDRQAVEAAFAVLAGRGQVDQVHRASKISERIKNGKVNAAAHS
jgi:predicted DNA-binding transcriptional regulator AlpA